MRENPFRKEFPFFHQQKPPLIYFDNAATAQKPQAVIERMTRYYTFENANIHRGSYPLSSQALSMYDAARETVRRFLDANTPEEIVFTKGSTEALNLAADVLCRSLEPGDNVVVTELEHSSNYVPWKRGCQRADAELRTAQAETDGSLRPERVTALIDSRTKAVAITGMSNVTGFRPELKGIIRYAHQCGALTLVDGAQAIVHEPVSVRNLDCDFFVFSGHKLYGPMGTGVLYGKRIWLEKLPPFLVGGGMAEPGEGGGLIYRKDPLKQEAGTQNIAGILGLEAAIGYLEKMGMENIVQYERELSEYLRLRLEAIEGIRVDGRERVSPVVSFELAGIGAYDLGILLGNRGIAVRSGAHCAYPLMRRMGKENSCRISLACYNTAEEIDILAERLEALAKRRRS